MVRTSMQDSKTFLPVANCCCHYPIPRSSYEEVLTWEEADAVLVTPVRHTGSPAICPLLGTPRSPDFTGYPDETSSPASSGGEAETDDIGTTLSKKRRDNAGEQYVRGEKIEGDYFSGDCSSEEEKNDVRKRGEKMLTSEEQSTSQEEDVSESDGDFSKEPSSEENSLDGVVPGNSNIGSSEGFSLSEELENDTEFREEAKARREDPTSDGGEDGAQNTSRQRPYFMYQRRKFVLKEGDTDEAGVCNGEEMESFGLVELPVGWQLGR